MLYYKTNSGLGYGEYYIVTPISKVNEYKIVETNVHDSQFEVGEILYFLPYEMEYIPDYVDKRELYTYEDLLNVMNLGMTLRQDQLGGYSGKSGNELLEEYIKNK